jgi:hypothetical protein
MKATTTKTATTKTESVKIEAYGVKGLNATPWRRTFKSVAALNSWVEKTDSCEVFGTRDAD